MGGINVGGDVSGTGIIIGQNIKTGDISINVVYETIKNFGLNLLPSTYFKYNQKTDENFEKWKKGFPLRLPSVMNCLEYRRDDLLKDIKRKLERSENNHRLLILGKPGSSKTTILMEIICHYFKDGYQILYNWENTNKIGNTADAAEFIGKLLNNDNKILIAVDDVHTDNAVGIFPIIEALSFHNKRENLIIILTARTPDYERFLDEKVSRLLPAIKISVQEIDDKRFRYILPQFTEPEIVEFIKHYFNEKEVQEFIMKHVASLPTEDDYKKIASSLYEKTGGDPIRIRFLVFGKGLALDARMSYDDYLQDDVKKLQTTLVCSLLDLANYVGSKELFEDLLLSDYAEDLGQESILEFSDGAYRTKHPSWDLELFSYIFSVKNKTILQKREQILEGAANLLFEFKNPVLTKSIISAAYGATRLETGEGGRVPIAVIERTIKIPKNLDSRSKYDIYTYFIGPAYMDLNLYEEAADAYLKATEIKPRDADAWYNRGLALANQGKYEDAIESLDKAIEIDPQNSAAWNNKGEYLRKQGKYEDAIRSYDKAIEIDPQNSAAWNNKGEYLRKQGKYEEAIRSYDKAIEIDPQNAYVWYNRGLAHVEQGKYEDAIRSSDKAIDIDPRRADAWDTKGAALFKQGKYEDAIESLDKAIEIDPQSAYAWINRGAALVVQGKYEDAIESLDKAIEIDPENAESWNNKGESLRKQGKYEDAIKSYDKAIEIDPQNAYAWYNRGLALDNQGKYEDGRVCSP